MNKRLVSYFTVAIKHLALGIITVLLVVACNSDTQLQNDEVTKSRSPADTLQIWWDKGFTLEEDEALQQIINNWQSESGKDIKLTFYSNDELPEKASRAIQAGTPPDLIMGSSMERELNPRLAWENKLSDVSDVIAPIQDLYAESALEAIYYYNNAEQKRNYYGVPISQLTIHIFYWRDLLTQAGKDEADIPQDWQGFWQFWQEIQTDLSAQSKQADGKIYGLGFPLSAGAADTYYQFEQILEAYNVSILSENGELVVEQPEVRQGIIDALRWYTDFYTAGYVSPDAVDWLNPDNNRSLLQRDIVMTPNTTLSIPAAVRKEVDVDIKKLGIVEFPNKPNGEPIDHLVAINSVVLLKDSPHQETAKDFLRYLVKPDTLSNYLKASGGRYLPVIDTVWETLGWQDSPDEHFATAAKTVIEGQTRPFNIAINPAYTVILQKNVWGQALNSIVVDKISPEQAADKAIAQIEEIFAEWEE